LAIARVQCEFFLVRYVPDLVKDEFVNIGVVVREGTGVPGASTLVRFTRDWSRVRCLDPDADIPMLESLEGELCGREGDGGGGMRSTLSVMEDSFSNSVQLTPGKGCLAENLTTEMELLMRLYVEPRKREAVSRRSARQVIYGAMRTQFERSGVWELMRKRIPAASYTGPGDPLRIDCGYRPNGVIRMFHAVALDGDLETAKVLAFSFPGLREGVRRVDQADLELTVVVEPLGAWEDRFTGKAARKAGAAVDADRVAQYRFAVETMERETIRVLTTSDLPRIAEAARRELRA
jgi:hypothetical protein